MSNPKDSGIAREQGGLGLDTESAANNDEGSTSTPRLRQKPSYLSVRSVASHSEALASPALSASVLLDDLDEADASALVDDIEESMRQSKTIEQFTRIITDYRHERKRRSYSSVRSSREKGDGHPIATHSSTPVVQADVRLPPALRGESPSTSTSIESRRSMDNEAMSDATGSPVIPSRPGIVVRCTCCCELESCERARRATTEWAEMEQDLRLAAEIGQALLRKHDALVESTSNAETRFASQRDALMKKLTRSIKESNDLEKALGQTSLNLEAADSSNRALLAELDGCRRDLSQAKADKAKLATAEIRNNRLTRELEDARQELQAEAKRASASEAKAKKATDRATQLAASLKQSLEDAKAYRDSEKERLSASSIEAAKERLRAHSSNLGPALQSTGDESSLTLSSLSVENEALQRQVEQTTALLQAANEEVASLREELVNRTSSRPTELMRSQSLRARGHHGRTVSGFNEAYKMPSMSTSSTDSAGNQSEDTSSQNGVPALSEEVVSTSEPRSHTRAGSLSGPRPLLLGTEGRSQSRSSTRTDSTSPRLGGGARLWSPTLPYVDSHSSEKATPSAQPPVAPTVNSVVNGRRTPSSEAQRFRAAYAATSSSSDTGSVIEEGTTTTASTTPNTFATTVMTEISATTPNAAPSSSAAVPKPRDARTTQLLTLLEYVQRLYTRLASADVDTLTKRLQRQHLAGDVGHLARVTLNGITRDAEGLREHFRRTIEAEARGTLPGTSSSAQMSGDTASVNSGRSGGDRPAEHDSSLLARKDFFAVVKLMRDLLFEMARLRSAINEVQLSPANASKILQEHLGVTAQEDKGVTAWFGKLISTGFGAAGAVAGAGGAVTPGSEGTATDTASSTSAAAGSVGASGGSTSARPSTAGGTNAPSGFLASLSRAPSRGGVGQPRSTSRGAAAVSMPSTVAVEVKGSRASATDSSTVPHSYVADPSHLPSDSRTTTPSASYFSSTPAGPSAGLGELRAGPRPNRGRANLSAGNRLSRVQSRNLSGLFAGAPADAWESLRSVSAGSTAFPGSRDRPLSRIVDDDEVSLHHGKPGWGNAEDEETGKTDPTRSLRRGHARGLSDSSIHSTFLEHADSALANGENGGGEGSDRAALIGLGLAGPSSRFPQRGGPAGAGAASATNRIMNRSTLALHAPVAGRNSPALSDDTASTLSVKEKAASNTAPSSRREGGGGGGGFLSNLGNSVLGGFPSLRPQTSSAALSLAAATASPTSVGTTVGTNEVAAASILSPPAPASALPIGTAPTAAGESSRSGPISPGGGSYSTSPAARGLLSASLRSGGGGGGGGSSSSSSNAPPTGKSASVAHPVASTPTNATATGSASSTLRPPSRTTFAARGSSRSGF